MRIRLGLGVAAALSVCALSGCDAATDDAVEADPVTTSSESRDSGDDPSGEPTGSGLTDGRSNTAVRLTNPGATLSVGDSAKVPVTAGDDGAGTIRITVTGIEQGDTQDLLDAEVDDGERYTPFYIHAEVEIRAQAGDGLSGLSVNTNLDGLIGTTTAGRLVSFGDFGPCPAKAARPDARVGDSFETCVVALAPIGDSVDGVQFSAYDSDYDTFDGDPVVWRES
ncbi:hypothetical protein [Nocardioides speluncae]|uniref:hypothetical protein n=1 Tax=Nocardioides speluncae TaxID=2670337 RepID=UPI000D69029E|nr:hypothetical protein [Nocardioides speluncae]